MSEFNYIVLDQKGFVQVDLFLPGKPAVVTVICKECGRVYQVEEGMNYPDDREHPHGSAEVAESRRKREEYERVVAERIKGPSS